MQFDEGSRGFSFQKDGPLDMRMNVQDMVSAKEVVNRFTETELGNIFRHFGEETLWQRGAKAIVDARRKKPIETTFELKETLEKVFPRRGKIHPATKVFQALRIFVNKELDHIDATLRAAAERLSSKGRMAVITFHSLEDRIVKNVFREISSPIRDLQGNRVKDAAMRLITKKPIVPSRREIRRNRRSRSAKLRIIEKV